MNIPVITYPTQYGFAHRFYKRGFIRHDNMVFHGYVTSGGKKYERWVTPEKFEELTEKQREYQRKYHRKRKARAYAKTYYAKKKKATAPEVKRVAISFRPSFWERLRVAYEAVRYIFSIPS